jgi:hypothetical protein
VEIELESEGDGYLYTRIPIVSLSLPIFLNAKHIFLFGVVLIHISSTVRALAHLPQLLPSLRTLPFPLPLLRSNNPKLLLPPPNPLPLPPLTIKPNILLQIKINLLPNLLNSTLRIQLNTIIPHPK